MRKFIIVLASVGYCGFIPFFPGTCGTVAGVLLYWIFSLLPNILYIAIAVGFFFLAWWAANRAEIIFGEKDSPRIVIDEVAGYLIAMFLLPRTTAAVLGGFLFFRLFDIIKPPPARYIDTSMQGGLAVVLDDVFAGIYVNILFHIVEYWYPAYFRIFDP